MAEAIVRDKKRYLPCAVYLNGEYGIKDLFCGVIAKLGSKGLEGVPVLEMNSEEKGMFEKSAASSQGAGGRYGRSWESKKHEYS
jgi:malate dehydrogenase